MTRPLPESAWKQRVGPSLAKGSRVLGLCPPGELTEFCSLLRAAVGVEGSVSALLLGEPFLHPSLPNGVQIMEGDPSAPVRLSGPYDAILAFGSEPFVTDFEAFSAGVARALRPGGHLVLNLPSRSFSPILEACHPGASAWALLSAEEALASLRDSGWREVRASTQVELRDYEQLGDLLDDLVLPFPLQFEGIRGQRLLGDLRANLASAFEGAEQLALTLRRFHVTAIR